MEHQVKMGSGYSDLYDDSTDPPAEIGKKGFTRLDNESKVHAPIVLPPPIETSPTPETKREEMVVNYSMGTSDYFENNSYYHNPLKDEVKLVEESYNDKVHNILQKCKYLNTRTFAKDLQEVIDMIKDPNAPSEVRLILGEWMYRKIYVFYKPNKKDVPAICEHLYQPIKDCNNIVLRGLYIHYHNVIALRNIAEHFFIHRHPERFFIIQMLNDVQLIQTTPPEEMLAHFLKWIRKSTSYDQRCNLLDILLRHFPNNEEVKEIHQKMKYGDNTRGKLVDLYQNDQNAHDEDITEETMKAASELLMWYRENKFDNEPKEGEVFDGEISTLDLALETIESRRKMKLLGEVIVRAKIDNTLFQGGFTIMQLFIALCRYISLSPHADALLDRLEEEFTEMNGLCSSGYINRFINTLQGFDEKYSVKIPFKKQLQSSLCHHINLALQNASEEVIAGSYDPDFRREYLEFIASHANSNLYKMIDQYGKKDVEDNIVYAMEELTGLPEMWSYEGGKVIAVLPERVKKAPQESEE